MFGNMRKALGIDDKIDILDYIGSLPTPKEQQIARAKIEKVEEDAMNRMVVSWDTTLTIDCTRRIGRTDESMLPA